jgi:hypothetical protein
MADDGSAALGHAVHFAPDDVLPSIYRDLPKDLAGEKDPLSTDADDDELHLNHPPYAVVSAESFGAMAL